MDILDPWLDLGEYLVRYSSLRFDARTRNIHLGRAFDSHIHVRCLCLRAGIPMGVGMRRAPGGGPIYYLYPLRREDPRFHADGCPHRVYDDENAVERHSKGSTSGPAYRFFLDCHDDEVLLHRLLLKARLTFWRPEFSSTRGYTVVRSKLIEGSKRIEWQGAPLGYRVFMAHAYGGPSTAPRAQAEWEDFVEQLGPSHDPASTGVVIGLVRSLSRPAEGGAFLHLHGLGPGLPIGSSSNLTGIDVGASRLIALLRVFRVGPSKVRVTSNAVSWLSEHFLPVASPAHAKIACELVDSRSTFSATLVHDERTAWAYPHFLVYRRGGTRSLVGLQGECALDSAA